MDASSVPSEAAAGVGAGGWLGGGMVVLMAAVCDVRALRTAAPEEERDCDRVTEGAMDVGDASWLS